MVELQPSKLVMRVRFPPPASPGISANPGHSPYALEVTAPGYEQIRARLAQAGFGESDAYHDDTTFGSWWVLLDTEPPNRVLWDGKERSLIVQRERAEGGWEDLWVATEPRDQNPDELMCALRGLLPQAS
jgi:hypothetical protein